MPTKVMRSDGLGSVVTAALFKEAIQKSVDHVCGLLKEAKADNIGLRDLVRLVVAAYQAPYMSEDMREEIYSTLVRELGPMSKQPQFSIGDVRLFWPKFVAKMKSKGMPLPDFADQKVQSIVKEVVQTLHGAHGQGAGKHTDDINRGAEEWLGRMQGPMAQPKRPAF